MARDKVYRRLPVNPERCIPELVNILADCTAGGQMGFLTNSRRLNAECINLGFSNSGKGEPELAEIIAGIENPACIEVW